MNSIYKNKLTDLKSINYFKRLYENFNKTGRAKIKTLYHICYKDHVCVGII